MDHQVVDALESAVRKTGLSKKKFVEEAIRTYAKEMGAAYGTSVWEETSGAW